MAETVSKTEEKKQETKKTEPRFSKERFLASSRYKAQRDLLAVLMDDKKTYTREEADKLIENFKKRKVK